MTAPRAVLADIHDLGLNPAYAHTITDKGGHLVAPANIKAGAKHAGVHINQRTLPVAEKPAEAPKPVQAALKKLPEAPKPEVKVEAKVEEPEAEVTVIASSKKKVAAPEAPVTVETPVVAAEAAKPVEKPTDEKPVS